jgi:hypothetical protein
MAWIEIGEVLFNQAWRGAAGLELGNELGPFPLDEWLRYLLGAVATAVVALAIAWRSRPGPVAIAFLLAALVFGVLTVRSARFAEYFVPFAVIALALGSRYVGWRPLPAVVLGALLCYSLPATVPLLGVLRSRQEWLSPPLAAELRAAIPTGAQVFTCEWGFTGTMMLALPDRRFVVALNPVYFYLANPELYALWFALPRQAPQDAASVIKDRFRARYVLCRWDDRFRPFFARLAAEPGVTPIVQTRNVAAYDLGA